jgi:hypothetical protein
MYYPLLRRVRNKVVFCTIGAGGLKYCPAAVSSKGFTFGDVEFLEGNFSTPESISASVLSRLQAYTQGGQVVMGFGPCMFDKIIRDLKRKDEKSELLLLQADPQSVVTSGYDPAQRYRILHQPGLARTLVCGAQDAYLKAIESAVATNKFKLARLQSTTLSLLTLVLGHPDVIAGKKMAAVFDHGVFTYVRVGADGAWEAVRSKPVVQGKVQAQQDAQLQAQLQKDAPNGFILARTTKTSMPWEPKSTPVEYFSLAGVMADHLEFFALSQF